MIMRVFSLILLLCCTSCLYSQQSYALCSDSLKLTFNFWGEKKYYKNDTIINKNEFQSILQTNQIAYQKYNKGKTLMTIGSIVGGTSAIFIILELQSFNKGSDKYDKVFYPSIATYIGGMVLYYIGKPMLFKSVKIYNSKFQTKNENQKYLKLGMIDNGLGLGFQF